MSPLPSISSSSSASSSSGYRAQNTRWAYGEKSPHLSNDGYNPYSRTNGGPRISFPFPSAGSPTHGSNSLGGFLGALLNRHHRGNLGVLLLGLGLLCSLGLNLTLYQSLKTVNSEREITGKGGGGSGWTLWNSQGESSSSSSSSFGSRYFLSEGWNQVFSILTPSSSTESISMGNGNQRYMSLPPSIESTIERHSKFLDLDHLVMVPGHSIWLGSSNDIEKVYEDDQWVLQDMQKGGSVKTFVKHIEEGVRVARGDEKALLVFSGGATRAPPAPPLSEAYSYRSLAESLSLLPSDPLDPTTDLTINDPLPINLRTTQEEFALDSYENLLFSIARFKEITSKYPEKITVVGYGMKERRFRDLHCRVIGFPSDRFEYIGINDEPKVKYKKVNKGKNDDQEDSTDERQHEDEIINDDNLKKQYEGEFKYGFQPFLNNPSGCHSPLNDKRRLRNPFFRYHPYHTSCPELIDLFEWCPALKSGVDSADNVEVFQGDLPWRITHQKGKGQEGKVEGEKEKDGWGRESW